MFHLFAVISSGTEAYYLAVPVGGKGEEEDVAAL